MSEGCAYHGICNLCGTKGKFAVNPEQSLREGYACRGCRAALRWRDQGALILDEFARGRSIFLHHLVSSGGLSDVDIYEAALRGPFVNALKKLPRYVQSYYWPDRQLGSVDEKGVRCEDLTKLSFADNSFDLVITSDVMEHVYNFRAAFAEITRVLKPGGVHVFTIPNAWPFPAFTDTVVSVVDGVEQFLKPPRYHNSGDGTPCIVYHDYGADLLDIIDATGCRTQAVRHHSSIAPCYVNATFISRKLGWAVATGSPR